MVSMYDAYAKVLDAEELLLSLMRHQLACHMILIRTLD